MAQVSMPLVVEVHLESTRFVCTGFHSIDATSGHQVWVKVRACPEASLVVVFGGPLSGGKVCAFCAGWCTMRIPLLCGVISSSPALMPEPVVQRIRVLLADAAMMWW